LADDFENLRKISDKAERVNKTGKQTLKHVKEIAKQREERLKGKEGKKKEKGVIANLKAEQLGMNPENNEPVGPIHEENFLEMFGEYLALKNDLEH
jgi:hypothetical protein